MGVLICSTVLNVEIGFNLTHSPENIMFLNERTSGHMVEILSLDDLFNLYKDEVVGCYHSGTVTD